RRRSPRRPARGADISPLRSYRALLGPAEQALRTEQDDDDQQDQRHRGAVLRRYIGGRQIVDDADQQPAGDGAAHLVEAADDRRDERGLPQHFAGGEFRQIDRRDQQRGQRDQKGVDQEGQQNHALDRYADDAGDRRILRSRLH